MSEFIKILNRPDGNDAPTELGIFIDAGRPGPSLVVSGFSPSTTAVYDRLAALPSIAQIGGQLTLLHVDRLISKPATARPQAVAPCVDTLIETKDDSLFLPFLPDDRLSPEAKATACDEGYLTILAKMAALDMISVAGSADRQAIARMAEARV